MDPCGAAQGEGCHFGQADGAEQPFFDEASEGFHHLFNRALLLAAVNIEQLYPVAAKAGERPVERGAQAVGRIGEVAFGFHVDPGLGGDADLGPRLGQEAPHHRFAVPHAIDFGHVPVIDAKIQRGVEAGETGLVIGGAIDAAKAHAAQADSPDRPTRQCPCLHAKAASSAMSTMSPKLRSRSSAGRASPVMR